MKDKEKLLIALSSSQFALWELHLYLDTHPNDMTALALHEKYEIKFNTLKQDYEKHFGPLSPDVAEGIEWLKNPWPWDMEGECN